MITPARIRSIRAAIKAATPPLDPAQDSLSVPSEAMTEDESGPLNRGIAGVTVHPPYVATKLAKLIVTIHTDNADLISACKFLAVERHATEYEGSDPLRKQLRRFDIDWKLVDTADLHDLNTWASLHFVSRRPATRLCLVSRSFEAEGMEEQSVHSENTGSTQEAA
jgi:hypothetical protein